MIVLPSITVVCLRLLSVGASVVFFPPTKEDVYAIARDVCLSVCLLARLLKNACMDLDELFRVDRCRGGAYENASTEK